MWSASLPLTFGVASPVNQTHGCTQPLLSGLLDPLVLQTTASHRPIKSYSVWVYQAQQKGASLSSQNPYSISPELLKELTDVLTLLKQRVLNAEEPPDDDSWFRYKGFAAAVMLINRHVHGIDYHDSTEVADLLVPSTIEDFDDE